MELRTLVDQARRGYPGAASRLFEACRPASLAFARRFLADTQEAEDAVQEAFYAASKLIDKLPDSAGFERWLFEIVRRRCLKARSRRKYSSLEAQGERRDPVDLELTILDRLELEAVFSEVDHFSEEGRQMFWMFYREDLRLLEIGQRLNLTVDVARKALHKMRVYLRQRHGELAGAYDATTANTTYIYDIEARRLPVWDQRLTTPTYAVANYTAPTATLIYSSDPLVTVTFGENPITTMIF